jgi:hypothetical protein
MKERFDELYKSIYDRNCVGCCLHIVLDDHNIGKGSIEFCLDWAKTEPNPNYPNANHEDCRAMAELLLRATVKERIEWLKLDPSKYDADGEYLCDVFEDSE